MRTRAVLLATSLLVVAISLSRAQEPSRAGQEPTRSAIEALPKIPDWQGPFFAQKHRSVRELALANTDADDTTLAILADFDVNFVKFSSLDLSNTRVTDRGMQDLAKLKSLKTLLLTGTALTDEGLKHLKDSPHLETLHLNSTSVTDKGLVHLRELDLVELYLFGTPVTAAGLDSISSIGSLRVLSIAKTNVRFPEFARAGPKHIRVVYLDTSQFREFMPERYYSTIFQPAISHSFKSNGFDAALYYAPNDLPPGLHLFMPSEPPTSATPALTLDAVAPSPLVVGPVAPYKPRPIEPNIPPAISLQPPIEVFDPAVRLPNINRVAIKKANASELEFVGRISGQLTDLELTRTAGLDKLFDRTRRFPKLESLNLADSDMADSSLETLLYTRIQCLIFTGSNVSDSGLEVISRTTRGTLRELQLSFTTISSAGIAKLSSCQELRVLKLNDTVVDDRGLSAIANLAKLESLDLEHTGITDVGIAELKALQELRFLNLANTAVGDAGLRALAACPRLRRVDVRNTNVSPVGTARPQLKLPQVEVLE